MIHWDDVSETMGYTTPEGMLKDLYEVQGLDTAEIAERLGTTKPTIQAQLRKVGIKLRSRGGANNKHRRVEEKIEAAGLKSYLECVTRQSELYMFNLTLKQCYDYFRGSTYAKKKARLKQI